MQALSTERVPLARRAYRLQEVADMLGVTRQSAYRLVWNGKLRAIGGRGKGTRMLVPIEELDKFLSGAASIPA